MAKKEQAAGKVRYRVLKPMFVNGSRIEPDPLGKTDVFVMADEGLESHALELAPERRPSRARPADNTGEMPSAAGETPNAGDTGAAPIT
jgi:hypothetical protein